MAADVREAPALREPRAGLLLAASTLGTVTTPEGAGPSMWGRGVQWEMEAHATTSEAYGARALICGPNSPITLGDDDKPGIEDAYPFQVYAFDWCTSLDQSRDWEGRARRLLLYTQSASIATEFWSGVLAKANAVAASVTGGAVAATNYTGQATTFNLAVNGAAPVAINLNANYTNAAGVVTAINTQFGSAVATQSGGVITITAPIPPLTGNTSVAITGYTQGTAVLGLGNGTVIGTGYVSNSWLARDGATVVAGGPYDVPHAIAQMDQALTVALTNSPGMMHMSPLVFSLATLNGHLRRDGDLWLSPMGHVAVADAGYSGLRDGAAGQWIIGTTPVEIVLGPIRITPPTEGFAYDVNTMVAYAQRDVLVMHEPSRVHLAVGVTP